MPRNQIKFLHLADLHLGRSFLGGKLKLPYEKARKRVRDQQDALIKAIEIAQNEKVDLILIAGDLYEEEGLTGAIVAFMFEVLGNAGIPVVISPGNHDYYSVSSHYSNEITQVTAGRRWPDNVTIVNSYDFTHLELSELPSVVITGIAYHSNQSVKTKKLREIIKPPDAEIQICIFHGSREGFHTEGKLITMPFSDAELLAQPYSYTALGHYHNHSTLKDKTGKIRAAYPGSPIALSASETGIHGGLLGTIHADGMQDSDLEHIELDPRRNHRINLDITGISHIQALEAKISEALQKKDVRKQDMALVNLSGSFPQGSRIEFDEDFLNDSCFQLTIDTSSVQPEWCLDEIDDLKKITTEGAFSTRLMELISTAEARGDEYQVIKLRNALFYGLDALNGRQIMPR
ncbi:DNA repair exonuclease [bacterium]|nr:DNA repair exonuclease [bacterium]